MGPRNSEPFAGLHSHVMHEGLLVFGVPAEIERNDPVAHEVEHNLLPCWGQPDNLTDRWDARLLLDEVSLTLSRRQWEAREPFDDPEANSEKLDFERYRDLDGSKESHLQLHGRTNSSPSESPSESGSEGYEGTLPPPGYAAIPFGYGDTTIPQNVGEANAAAPTDGHLRQTSSTGGKLYNTVGFSYDSTAQQADLSSMSGQAGSQQAQQAQHVPAPGSDEPAFVPDFVIPEHLRRALPTTARHFKVIQQTANFVREGGGQLEVLLRVKQAGNPLFDFLLPTSTLHPFYRWLVTTRPEDLVVINAAPLSWGRKGEGQNGQHGNALDAGARGETRGPVQQGQREVQQAEQRAAPHPLQQEQEGQREPQDEAAELDHAEPAGRAGYCVQYGPEPRPPEALSSLDLLSQYDDDFVKSPRGGSSASQDTETRAGSRSYGGDGADEGAGDGQQLGQQQQQRQDRGGVAVQGTLPYETAPGVGISQAQGPGPEEQGEGTAAGPAEGVEPPADMLAVMQKLVAFVQKNGWRFEGMVRAKESDNPLFGFLHPWHPQHLRYRHMLVNAIGSQDTDTIMLYAAPGESSAFQHAADDRAAGRSSSPQPPDQGTLPTEAKASEGHDLEPQDAEHGEDATGKPLPPWLYSFKLSSKGPAEIKQQQPSDHVPKVSSSVSHPAEGRAVPAVPAASATPSTISDMQQLATVGTGTKADKPAAASSSATAAGGSHTLPPWLREKMVAAASAAAGSISAQLATTKGAAAATGPVKVKLQANPSIAKVSLRLGPVLPASEEEGGEKAAEEAHVEAVAGGAEEAPGRASPSAMASVAPVQEGLLGRAHEGEQPTQAAPAEVNDAEAEERKKAERRRRARELLLQKQQEAALQAARQRQQQLSAISIHRKAFLEEGSEGAGGLVGEGARDGVTAAHAAAEVRGHAVEVEEGEIAAAEVAAPKPGGEGTAQLGRPPRHPSRLPLVEDLVTLRMKHTSSGGDLTASGGERVPGGDTSAAAAARHGLLAPPGQTIAGHRAAFGEGGTASGSQARGRRDGAAGREDSGDGSGAVGQLVPGQSAQQGEAALHLRRIRDRIAAMTAGGASSRPGSGLSTASSGPTTSNVRQPRVGGESVSRASRQGTPSSSADSDGSEVGGKAGMRWRVASPARQKVSSSRSRSRHSASRRRHRSRSHSRNTSSSGSSGASGSSKGRGKSRTRHSRERPAHRAQQKRRRRSESGDRHEEGRERKDRKHRRHSSGRRHKH